MSFAKTTCQPQGLKPILTKPIPAKYSAAVKGALATVKSIILGAGRNFQLRVAARLSPEHLKDAVAAPDKTLKSISDGRSVGAGKK